MFLPLSQSLSALQTEKWAVNTLYITAKSVIQFIYTLQHLFVSKRFMMLQIKLQNKMKTKEHYKAKLTTLD